MNDYDNFYISLIIFFFLFSNLLFILFQRRKNIPDGKFKLILINFSLLVYFLFMVLFIGESYYRFFVDRTDSFSISKISERWLERHFRENNKGVRDNKDYRYRIENGKYRISLFGDSFTAGHGIKNVDKRFSNILRDKYPTSLEVHNMSWNGASTTTHLKNLHILKEDHYEFNIVLLVYCLNDIDYLVDEAAEVYKRIHAFNKNQSFFVRKSYFINNLAFRLYAAFDPDIKNYNDFLLDAYRGETLQKHFAKLDEIIELTKKMDIPFMVATFPFLQTSYEDYQFREVHQKLDQFWKSNGILHLDLLDVYKDHLGKDLTVNAYDAHPNELAHQLAAEAIDEFFKRQPPTK